jgi:EmrB/QacA subfamily drug resistance transporter
VTARAAPAPAAPTPAPPTPALTHRQVLTILSGLLLGMLMASLDQTIVATALPTIVGDLGGLDFYSWSITAYLLATTVSTPVYGKLGDIIGRKRVFQVAIVIFLVGSVLCGLSRSMGELVAARAVQGIGAGGLIVVAQAIIADVVSPRERGRYQGYFGAVFGASSVLGPLLGGWFTEALSWRWVFYVNIPVGIAALIVTSVVLPFDRRHRSARIDYAGVALFSAAICCVVLLTTWGGSHAAWTSPTILGLGAASLVLLGLFVVVERRVAEPLLPLRLFKGRVFAVCCGLAFLVGFAMYATVSFVPVFLQIATGASPTTSGLLLLPLMGGLLFGTVLTGQLVTRTGRYKIFPVVGMAMATVGLVPCPPSTPTWTA